ncbi:MAG: LysM peptidoglycan-binding domain-containing protein [Mariprofundales bacterium]|nr:LysM peptidoglycan-binding domain-containing protein [Mariprofundales bacterium]
MGTLLTICTLIITANITLFTPGTAAAVDRLDNDTNLLAGLLPHDIRSMRTEARRVYTKKRWQSISERSQPYRYRILRILQKRWAPAALQLIPVAESGYSPYALSPAGASGLWQLMPATAREWGADTHNGINGRRSVDISTETAVRYLLMMHDSFASWPLAIAGYHMGPYGLAKRLKRTPWSPSQGINAMPIPASTRAYVRTVLGLVSLWQDGELRFPEPEITSEVLIPPPLDVRQLARWMGVDHHTIFNMNPGLDYSNYYANAVKLVLPVEQALRAEEQSQQFRPRTLTIRVQHGDSLWSIAHRYGSSVAHIKRLNPQLGRWLRSGDLLAVPANDYLNAVAALNPLLHNSHRIHYRVKSGDTLWRIARNYGSSVRAIRRINHLSKRWTIRPGDWLWIKSYHHAGRT